MKILKALAVLGIASLLTISAHAQTLVKPSQGGTGIGSYSIGDIIYASASNILSKLGIGSDGTCLKVAGGLPTWDTCGGGSLSGGTAGMLSSWVNSTTLTATSAPTFANFFGTSTATSTLTGQLLVNRLQVSTTTATSTFAGGVQINRLQTLATSTLAGLVIDAGGLKISTLNCSASSELLQTDASGNVICGSDDSGGGGSYPFPVAGNATSTLTQFNGGLTAYSSSTISSLTVTNGTTTNATTSNLAISSLSSALVRVDANGSTLEYAGTSCTNQFVRSLDAAGAATCATVANTDLANSTISGISLGSNLANLSATDSTLTFSGTYNGGTARTIGVNLTNGNVWTPASTTFVNGVTIGNATTTNATSTTFRTGTLGVGSEYITDITGTGLTITGGALTVSSVPNSALQNSTIALTDSNSTLTIGGSPASLGGTLTATLNLASQNIWTGASTTFVNGVSITNGTTTNATSTTLAVTGSGTSTRITNNINIGGNMNVGGSATNTFANGISLASGCFSVNNVCIGASGSSASSTLLSDNNTFSGANIFNNITRSTTTDATSTTLAVTGSGTSTRITNNINIGGNINVGGSASNTFSNGINLSAGCFAINGTCLSGSGSGTSSWLAVKMGIATSTGSYATGFVATTVPITAGQIIRVTGDASINCQQQQYIHLAVKPAGSGTTTIGKNYDDNNCGANTYRPRSLTGEFRATATENLELYLGRSDLSYASTTLDVFSAGTTSIAYTIYEYGAAAGGGGGTPGGSDGQVQYNNGGSFGGGTGFVWDDANNYLGIGTTTPDKILTVVGNQSGGIMKIDRRVTSATDIVYGTQIIQATHDVNMGDGFGVAQTFNIQDNAGVSNIIGDLRALRRGADTTGAMALTARKAGVVDDYSALTVSGLTSSVGIGTSTPAGAAFVVSSSTAPQLSLTDGSLTSVQHIFRSMGNTFNFSTSSPSTYATSSVPIFSVDANGFLKFGNPRSIATTTQVRLQGCSPSTQSARFAPGGAYWGPLDMTNDAVDQWAWYMVNATSSSITCKVQIPQNLAPVPNPRLISVYSATTTTVANYALDIDIAQYDPLNGSLDPAATGLTNILAGSTTASQRLVNRNTAFQTVGTSTSIGSTLTAGNTLLVRFTYWGADADDTSNTDLLFLDEESKLLVDLMAQ